MYTACVRCIFWAHVSDFVTSHPFWCVRCGLCSRTCFYIDASDSQHRIQDRAVMWCPCRHFFVLRKKSMKNMHRTIADGLLTAETYGFAKDEFIIKTSHTVELSSAVGYWTAARLGLHDLAHLIGLCRLKFMSQASHGLCNIFCHLLHCRAGHCSYWVTC